MSDSADGVDLAAAAADEGTILDCEERRIAAGLSATDGVRGWWRL